LHFSDYHSHALPFYSEGDEDVAGIARAIAYLKPYAKDPNTLILSGGDMINKGSPAWSDKYHHIEGPWFNGLVQAMSFGNHDADYGVEDFVQHQSQIDYPILASNVLDSEGQPLFQYDGKTYMVFQINGLKIGVFAVVGLDFQRLLKPETSPAHDISFADRIETARQDVKYLREIEKVNAVVLIGHALYEDDLALAQAVPGIDLIFGTHSHRKEGLTLIPGTKTRIISPSQYLTYVSKVQMSFVSGNLNEMKGELVHMSNNLQEDPEINQKVSKLQSELEADSSFAHLYQVIGETDVELSTQGQFTGESVLGNWVADIVRESTNTSMAILTASGFRQTIPPGVILEQYLLTALPYKNEIFVYTMTGQQIQALLDLSVSHSKSDFFSQVSGVRFNIVDGKAVNIQIQHNPHSPIVRHKLLNPDQNYKVATNNFQALVAEGYKDIFAQSSMEKTGLDVWDELRKVIRRSSPITTQLDGRIIKGLPNEKRPWHKSMLQAFHR